MNAKRSTGGRTHRFGGDWTTAKLDVIARYFASYTTALKDKPSEEHPVVKGYIDAFAGTGYRMHGEMIAAKTLHRHCSCPIWRRRSHRRCLTARHASP